MAKKYRDRLGFDDILMISGSALPSTIMAVLLIIDYFFNFKNSVFVIWGYTVFIVIGFLFYFRYLYNKFLERKRND